MLFPQSCVIERAVSNNRDKFNRPIESYEEVVRLECRVDAVRFRGRETTYPEELPRSRRISDIVMIYTEWTNIPIKSGMRILVEGDYYEIVHPNKALGAMSGHHLEIECRAVSDV